MSNIDRHPRCHMRTSLGNCDPLGGFCTSVNEPICEALHKASRLQEWIPCEERLPEDKCDVLIQFGWNMAVGCIDGGDWRINSGDAWCTDVAEDDGKPIAWIPLPETYQPDGFTKWAKSVADSYRNDKEESE